MKTCKRCNKEIPAVPHANNVKYCKPCRAEVYKYIEYRKEYGRRRRGMQANGKLQCLICMRWYRKVLSHVWQCHGVLAHEYKDTFGIEQGKGLIDSEQREALREHVKANADVVVKNNLINKGKMTRFKKGDREIGRYKRSAETLEKLRVLYKKTKKYKAKHE